MGDHEPFTGASFDAVQGRLADYAAALDFADLTPAAIHAAKVRIIDTFAALFGGFDGDPCKMARDLAAKSSSASLATILGTRLQAAPDMAAFANATGSRYAEANDLYRWPKSTGGHPSDVILPVLAAAESVHADGRSFIAGVVLAYEVYCRLSDCMDAWGKGVEPANFARIAIATATAKLWKLDPDRLSQAIAIAAVSGNMVRQVRSGHLSVWKAVASGEAGRAGIYAATLAQCGFGGPHMPFEGKHGWAADIARQPIQLKPLDHGKDGFKVQVTLIKPRSTCGATISSALAAEKIAPALRTHLDQIEQIRVETYQSAKDGMGTGAHLWNPQSRETADHSIPYVVAAALVDGTIGPRQFDHAHRADPRIRSLLAKVSVEADDAFTQLYLKHPAEHHGRVTVTLKDGRQCVGKSGAADGDLSNPVPDRDVEDKFRTLCDGRFSDQQTAEILSMMWEADRMEDVSALPPLLVQRDILPA